ncbi:MAG: ABC transporter permease [Muribaculaceae bacterium]|nr:ABC transporter permease [Muribaculaceae bacterium]
MKAIKQILFDFRHQAVISWVTLSGTMLSVFLIMIVVMMQQVQIAPFAPESNRDRLLYGRWMHVNTGEGLGGSSSSVSLTYAHQLYDSLANVEVISFVVDQSDREVASLKGKLPMIVDKKMVDDNYWKIFNHSFIYGKPFDRAQFDAGMKVAVITESVAKELFNRTDVVDRELLLNHVPYKVTGVIKDVSSLTTEAYGQVFIPWTTNNSLTDWNKPYFGNAMVYLLARSPKDIESIRKEVEHRYEVLNTQDRGDNSTFIYHGQPFTQEMRVNEHGSNNDPDIETPRKMRYFIFAILLIIPAINLSSMTQSRLRRRVGEFGVRRAFGCTRSRIMLDILNENLILTIAGGILGVLLSLGFTWLFSDLMFTSMFDDRSPESMYITPEMVFNLPIFLWTLLFCLILNILSASIPAWRAARVNPVEAINMGNK